MAASKPLAGIYPYLVSPVDGSTGEFAYLDREQKAEIIRIVVDQVAGRVPVVPGVSSVSTVDALKQVEQATELGADAIVLMLQAFFPVPPAGVVGYFTAVAER